VVATVGGTPVPDDDEVEEAGIGGASGFAEEGKGEEDVCVLLMAGIFAAEEDVDTDGAVVLGGMLPPAEAEAAFVVDAMVVTGGGDLVFPGS